MFLYSTLEMKLRLSLSGREKPCARGRSTCPQVGRGGGKSWWSTWCSLLRTLLCHARLSLYALCTLITHDLQGSSLHDVVCATTLTKMLYASKAWWGFSSQNECEAPEVVLQRLFRGQYLPSAVWLSSRRLLPILSFAEKSRTNDSTTNVSRQNKSWI